MKALVVDDNQINQMILGKLLENVGIQVSTADNGREALRALLHYEYSIVFMDQMMPIMSGTQATRDFRKMNPLSKVPIIAISGRNEEQDKKEFLYSGMNDYLEKPIAKNRLYEILRKWLPDLQMDETKEKEKVEKRELSVLADLDVTYAIEMCGSKKLFDQILYRFYQLIPVKADKIEECMKQRMLKDYLIEIHALKNTAASVGALELSGMAKELEKDCESGNEVAIWKNTPRLLEKYRSYRTLLKEVQKENEQKKERLTLEQKKDILHRMEHAIDKFNLDIMDQICTKLETYYIEPEYQEQVEQLQLAVADVNMELALSITQNLIRKVV